jgi:dienelactone hydrolase
MKAEIHTENIEYVEGGTVLEGFLAYDAAIERKRPGVIIAHEWTGIGQYVKHRAEQLAKLGYVAFCADIYGKGVRPQDPHEAAKEANKYKSDPQLLRARMNAALKELRRSPHVDQKRIAAIGYCFGGTAALELARSGADIAGAVSFHGGLATEMPTTHMKAKVLALHGADDPFVPQQQVTAFEEEMRHSQADWQLIMYGGAVHSFTNPESGNAPSKGMAYNKAADRRSWEAMLAFFDEIFS